jgi:hypothetical protein
MHPAQPENDFSKNNQVKIESPFLFSGVFVQLIRIANDRPPISSLQNSTMERGRDLIGVTLGVLIKETSIWHLPTSFHHNSYTINSDRLVLSHNKTAPVL